MFSKIKKIFLYAIVIYAILGFILLPLFLKSELKTAIEQETLSLVEIDSVSFNPFIFKLELEGLTLSDLDKNHLVSFSSFVVDVDVYSLFYSAVHLRNITLLDPKISLVYNKNKTINLLNILKKSEVKKEDENSSVELPRIIIDKIIIADGTLQYKDFTQKSPFEFGFDKIGFELRDIDTADVNSTGAAFRLYSTLGDGGFLDFKTDVLGYEPLELGGSLEFEASKLYTEWKYMRDKLNLEVADGKVSFKAEYYLNLSDLNATKIDKIDVSLEKLRIKPKDKHKDILNLEHFYVNNASVEPMKQSINIDKIGLLGLNVKVKRSKSSKIDWIEYIKVDSEDEVSKKSEQKVLQEAPNSAKTQPWSLQLQELALEKIALSFEDKAISPSVKSEINELNIYAQNITLAGKKPFSYQINTRINSKARCSIDGTVIHSKLDLFTKLECSDFDIVHYRPYIDKAAREALSLYDVKLISASTAFDADMRIQKIDKEIALNITNADFYLNDVKVNKRSNGERLAAFKSFDIEKIVLNSTTKSLQLNEVSLNSLSLNVQRYKDGKINLDKLIVAKQTNPKKHTKRSKKNKKSKEFGVLVKKFSLKGARVDIKDKRLTPTVKNKIDRIYFNAYNINVKKYSWLSYNLSMRVNTKGSIKAKGKLRHTPLKQKGNFDIKNISLKELTPYLQESAFVSVEDGRLSIKGKTAYSVSSKSPDLRVNAGLKLSSVFVNDTQDNSLLLSLNEADVKSITLELKPNRLFIDEIDIDSFFVNAIIDENRVMNFAKLAKSSADVNASMVVKEEKEIVKEAEKEDFPVQVVKINIALGSARFADYSIPLRFKTHIHDLGGVIYSISSSPGETTYINLNGGVDEYGLSTLKGSIDISDPKAFTDLDLVFKNLEMNSFSGYSATFAGHEIESGKLYLDLGYDVLNSELQGRNSVILKNVKLGDEVDDENVTVLPLGFVIGLLEDSDGIIDIDMPVEGNLNEPDFKYGALVFKTLGGLIAKAVLSPFKFLGAMMGMDGEALSYIEFEAGTNTISPPEREKLDEIAKMMLTKPKISLALSGTYDENIDKLALQKEKLIQVVLHNSGILNRDDHKNALTIDLLEDIYDDMSDDDRADELEERLEKKYKDEEFNRAYQEGLLKLCIGIQKVTIQELKALAESRSEALFSYLTQEKSVEISRIRIDASKGVDKPDEFLVKVDLQIEVK